MTESPPSEPRGKVAVGPISAKIPIVWQIFLKYQLQTWFAHFIL